jgi:DNA-binding LacI/PurR family transcriptional regulator
MPATIRDVAKKAQVGIGTVSRVLNNSPSVRDETRLRVISAIEELDYTPNPIARRLSTGQSLTIGVGLPYLTMPSFIARLRGVQSVLADSMYDLVLFDIENPKQRDSFFHNLSLRSRVDGVLLISLPPDDDQADALSHLYIPVVLIDGYHPDLNCVYPDDKKGGRIATRHLIELGHRKIAFMSDFLTTPFHPSMYLRYQGYREVLQEENIPYLPKYQLEGERGRINARAMARNLLSQDDPPTAVVAASDTHAIGVMDAAQELGVRVPEELSVIGYDNIRDAEYMNLTTIDQHLEQSGIYGAQLLLELLDNHSRESCCKKILDVELVVRGTTHHPPLRTAR